MEYLQYLSLRDSPSPRRSRFSSQNSHGAAMPRPWDLHSSGRASPSRRTRLSTQAYSEQHLPQHDSEGHTTPPTSQRTVFSHPTPRSEERLPGPRQVGLLTPSPQQDSGADSQRQLPPFGEFVRGLSLPSPLPSPTPSQKELEPQRSHSKYSRTRAEITAPLARPAASEIDPRTVSSYTHRQALQQDPFQATGPSYAHTVQHETQQLSANYAVSVEHQGYQMSYHLYGQTVEPARSSQTPLYASSPYTQYHPYAQGPNAYRASQYAAAAAPIPTNQHPQYFHAHQYAPVPVQHRPQQREYPFHETNPQDAPTSGRTKKGNLPKWTVDILTEWYFEHKRNPFPKQDQKDELKARTKLRDKQIDNWFINARRRKVGKIAKTMIAREDEEAAEHARAQAEAAARAQGLEQWQVAEAAANAQAEAVAKARAEATAREAEATDNLRRISIDSTYSSQSQQASGSGTSEEKDERGGWRPVNG